MQALARGSRRRWQRLHLAVVLLVAVATIGGGCAPDRAYRRKQAERSLNDGVLALQAGNVTMALELFLKAYEQDPENATVHFNLGIAYWAKEALDKAVYHFKEAIRLRPDYSEAYNNLGVLYLNQGQTDAAIAMFNKALENLLYLNPQNAHYNLGRAFLLKKDYNKAAFHLEKAVRLVPDFGAAHAQLGQTYELMGREAEAVRAYRQALKFVPRDALTHLRLGKLLYRLGDLEGARAAFEQVRRLAPGSPEAVEARRYLGAMK